MSDDSSSLTTLLVVFWATLAVLVALFLRMAMRWDAGYGAAGRSRAPMPRSVIQSKSP